MNHSKVNRIDTTAAHRLLIMVGSDRLLAIIAFKHQWAMPFTVLPQFRTYQGVEIYKVQASCMPWTAKLQHV
jgi:hypothetical protein